MQRSRTRGRSCRSGMWPRRCATAATPVFTCMYLHDILLLACAEVKDTGAPLQLRDVAVALRKSDDVNGVLKALQQAGPLIAAAPDELGAFAGPDPPCLLL